MSTRDALTSFPVASVDFEKVNGLVPVVAQHAETGVVLMLAFMTREALQRTIETGEMHYHSRRRGLWHKGATSGNVQKVLSLSLDCDRDSLLARVIPAGPACHTGETSCFGAEALAADTLATLDATISSRIENTGNSASYTRRLAEDKNLRLKKLGEEVAELVLAAANDDTQRMREECADLIYHLLVAARASGVTFDDIRHTLAGRAR